MSKDIVALLSGGGGSTTGIPENYQAQVREAYKKNVVAFVAISRIAASVADLPIQVFLGGDEVEYVRQKGRVHPVWALIKKPSPMLAYRDFIQLATTYKLISGNAYFRSISVSTGKVQELELLRPDRVKIEARGGKVICYEYSLDSKTSKFPVDPITFDSEVLHIKEPHPLDDLYGLSPVTAASLGISQNNKLGEWNNQLLNNAGCPSGLLTLKQDGTGSSIGEEQVKSISEQINAKYGGYKNAGKIAVLSWDFDWKQLGMSPKDMDWIMSKSTSARDIALAFGYPPYLLGMAEGSTFNNVSEARLALYLETVIPFAKRLLEGLSDFLSRKFKQEIEIALKLDDVDALAPLREKQRKQSREDFSAGILTLNEVRKTRGYEEVDGGDEIMVPVGKLPLGFDSSQLDDKQYRHFLEREGLEEKTIQEFLALSNEQKTTRRALPENVSGGGA